MTKSHSSDIGVLPEIDEYDLEDAETDVSVLPIKGSPSLREAQQYFNGKMLEKMRPKKVAKFRTFKKLESDY